MTGALHLASHVGGTFRMQPYSMRFTNPAIEVAYMKSYSEQGCLNLSRLAAVTGLLALVAIVRDLRTWDSLDTASQMKTISLAIGVLVLWLYSILPKMPCIQRKLTPRVLEVAVMVIMALHLSSIVFAEPTFLRVCFSFDAPPGSGSDEQSNDEWYILYRILLVALSLDAVITAVHLALPLRWFLVIWGDAMFLVSFSTFSVLVGGVTAQVITITFLMFGLSVAACVGLRSMEFKNRVLFATIADERALRAQAEFAVVTREPLTPHKDTDGASSIPHSKAMTTDTGAMFQDAAASGSLESIVDLGLQEQWLIGERELEVNRDEKLGSGGFGVVFAGKYCKSPVAVKTHLTTGSSGSCRVDRTVLNELRILRHVCHPNIAVFHGALISWTSEGSEVEVLLVLERIRGLPLDALVSKLEAWRGLSPQTTKQVQVMLQVVSALVYLHSRRPPIVHADLKPSNILVQKLEHDYVPKLLDFGLSRTVTRHAKLQGGTPHYLAPEIIKLRETYQPSPSCDIFSLGRLLFFVASGRKPLASIRPKKLMAIVLEGREPPSLSWRPSTELLQMQECLIQRCTTHEARDRPTAAGVYELLHELAPPEGRGCVSRPRRGSSRALECTPEAPEEEQLESLALDSGSGSENPTSCSGRGSSPAAGIIAL